MEASSGAAVVRGARLYAITPDGEPGALKQLVRAWLEAGVRLVQLRQTRLPRRELYALAKELAGLVSEAGGALVVNDQLDVALAGGAHGVHLGPDDLSVGAARGLAPPPFLVGASAATAAAAREAAAAGADYLGSGPAFATATKTTKPVIGPEGVARVAAAVELPVFAIGGITAARVPELRAAGVDRVAAISALAGGAGPVRDLLQALA